MSTRPTRQIEFKIKPTFIEIARCYTAAFKLNRTFRLTYRLCLVVLILCVLALNVSPETTQSLLNIMAIMLISILFLPLAQHVHIERYYKSKPDSYFEACSYVMDNEIIRKENSFTQVLLHWNAVDCVVQNDDFFLICSRLTSVEIYMKYLTSVQIDEVKKITHNAKEKYGFKVYNKNGV